MKIFNHNTYPRAIIRLKPSKLIEGQVGVFALKDFKKGEVIIKDAEFKDNNTMTVDEYNLLDKNTKELVKAHSTIEEEKLYIPENINHINTINFLNHSCDPNIGFNENDDYVAIKNIFKGKELTLDYSFLNTNVDYKMLCLCKSKKCRGVIIGNEWKKKDFSRKNKDYFVSTIRKRLKDKGKK